MKGMRSLLIITAAAAAAYGTTPVAEAPVFTPEARAEVMTYWSTQGTYDAGLPESAQTQGSWKTRPTVEGSEWIYLAYKSLRVDKDADESLKEEKAKIRSRWRKWLDARGSYDRGVAAAEAAERNSAEVGKKVKAEYAPAPKPDQMPRDLKEQFGAPPMLYEPVQPYEHRIGFHDGTELTYTSGVRVPNAWAYYRHQDGVRSSGSRVKTLPADQIDALFRGAGISESEQRIMQAVSILEGGFDAVNTYDTGHVSIGFIQFACLNEGGHSLGQVLLSMKANNPEAYHDYFQQMGLDVTDDGLLAALDPITGLEFTGPEAANKIIADKRFPAVFQRAGQLSEEFRMAQLVTARDLYYPEEMTFEVEIDGELQAVTIGEIFKTEAGLATIMDRKVQTGGFGDLDELLPDMMADYGITELADASAIEYELISAMKHRKDYLQTQDLSRPQPTSRSGGRRKRGGGG